MTKKVSLEELNDHLNGWISQVQVVQNEVAEIQTIYVSTHLESKTRHNQTLNELSFWAAGRWEDLPADVRKAVETRLPAEGEAVDKRRKELRGKLIPDLERAADQLLLDSQADMAKMREMNPRLNDLEESLKARRVQMETELDSLNQEIAKRSGCLQAIFNFSKLTELDRQREKMLGRLEGNAASLRQVREEWDKAHGEHLETETDLQQRWQNASLQLAGLRDELATLDDDRRRTELVLQRAVRGILDEWKTPIQDGSASLTEKVNQMAQYNIETDAYEMGLGKVAGLIALLGGVKEGFKSFRESVTSLIEEQATHSAYLSPVAVNLSDEVIHFNAQWKALQEKVRNEQTLGAKPLQFSALFDHEVDGWLSKTNITRMFDALTRDLKSATSSWSG
jgi:hypothetical protein